MSDEDDPYGFIGLTGPMLLNKMLASRWYVQPNDTVGGWCIMPVPLPRSSGYPAVASLVIDKIICQEIVELHNMDLHEQEHRD